MNEVHVTRMNGTGAAIDIYCGFKPAKVEVLNFGSATKEQLDWYVGMPDASAIKTVTGAVARTYITSNGITMLESASLGLGFRIGADADVNVNGEALVILAFRGGEGNQQP